MPIQLDVKELLEIIENVLVSIHEQDSLVGMQPLVQGEQSFKHKLPVELAFFELVSGPLEVEELDLMP